jgi:hypothetical protein
MQKFNVNEDLSIYVNKISKNPLSLTYHVSNNGDESLKDNISLQQLLYNPQVNNYNINFHVNENYISRNMSSDNEAKIKMVSYCLVMI